MSRVWKGSASARSKTRAGAREVALVAVGAEQVQRVRADLRLDPLRAQLGEHAVAVVDLEHVGLPAVHVALVGAREQHRQVAQPLAVAGRDRACARRAARRGGAICGMPTAQRMSDRR